MALTGNSTFKLFDGGSQRKNPDGRMYPSSVTPATVANEAAEGRYSYADHQRARHYVVTKDLDFGRPRNGDIGGNGSPALFDFYMETMRELIDADNAALFFTHFLIPNTVLKSLSWGTIDKPAAGATSIGAVTSKIGVYKKDGTAATALVPALPAAAADLPGKVNYHELTSGLFIPDTSDAFFVGLELGAIATANVIDGLRMWVAAEVIDLNHGNVS